MKKTPLNKISTRELLDVAIEMYGLEKVKTIVNEVVARYNEKTSKNENE